MAHVDDGRSRSVRSTEVPHPGSRDGEVNGVTPRGEQGWIAELLETVGNIRHRLGISGTELRGDPAVRLHEREIFAARREPEVCVQPSAWDAPILFRSEYDDEPASDKVRCRKAPFA